MKEKITILNLSYSNDLNKTVKKATTDRLQKILEESDIKLNKVRLITSPLISKIAVDYGLS